MLEAERVRSEVSLKNGLPEVVAVGAVALPERDRIVWLIVLSAGDVAVGLGQAPSRECSLDREGDQGKWFEYRLRGLAGEFGDVRRDPLIE